MPEASLSNRSSNSSLLFDKKVFLEGGRQFEDLVDRLREGKREMQSLHDLLSARLSYAEEHKSKLERMLVKKSDAVRLPDTVKQNLQSDIHALGETVNQLKNKILPALCTMIKEQKRIKDAQKTAIAVTTKKLQSYGEKRSKLAERMVMKERELASLDGQVLLTKRKRKSGM